MNTKKTWKVRTIDLRQLEHYLNETNETVFGIYPSVNLSGSVEVVSYTEPFVPVAPGSTSPIKQVLTVVATQNSGFTQDVVPGSILTGSQGG